MAVAVGVLSDTRRRTLEAVCDTFAPSMTTGDGSAFPSAPGVNPMISIMSLVHRSAANLLIAS